MATITAVSRVTSLMDALSFTDDAYSVNASGVGSMRDMVESYGAVYSGLYEEGALNTAYTEEELSTITLNIIRELVLDKWRQGRGLIESHAVKEEVKLAVDNLSLGTHEEV